MSVERSVPAVAFAHVGGSGSWGFDYPRGVFGADQPLEVRRVDGPLVFETPYGPSPPFGLYELHDRQTDARRQYLRVWMHGLEPADELTADDPYAATPMRAAEKVFSVLEQAGTRWVLIDASVGGINPLLDPWDLVISHDFIDDMKRVVRLGRHVSLSLRQPYCPYLRRLLFEAAGEQLPRYTALAQQVAGRPIYPKIVKRGIYVCPDGPWFESPAQIRDYQQRGFDIVGKTVVPEVQLARYIGVHFATINPVVNPAEGIADPDTGRVVPWSNADLATIYDHYGPTIAAMLLSALARVDEAQGEGQQCECAALRSLGGSSRFLRFIER